MNTYDNVRVWSPEESEAELARLEGRIRALGMTVEDMRHRAEEWDLDPRERALMDRYKQFESMVRFARRELAY